MNGTKDEFSCVNDLSALFINPEFKKNKIYWFKSDIDHYARRHTISLEYTW